MKFSAPDAGNNFSQRSSHSNYHVISTPSMTSPEKRRFYFSETDTNKSSSALVTDSKACLTLPWSRTTTIYFYTIIVDIIFCRVSKMADNNRK